MLESIAPYRKAFAYLVVGVVQALVNFGTDNVYTAGEILHSVIFGLGLGAVYLAEETPYSKHVKTVMAAIVVALQGIVAAMDVGLDLTTQVWLSVAVGVAAVLGVAIPKNDQEAAVPATAEAPPIGVAHLG
jgi:peptidoglycan/LPS O-acetylase OafA/YrhL